MVHPGLNSVRARRFELSTWQWLITAILVGLGLRLLFLGSKSLWLDEALSINLAADPRQLFSNRFDHSHPPLYYTLLHYWLQLGNSESMLRLSSALLGSVAIPLSYALAANLGGRPVALSMTWLVALSPLLVWYAQELRSYSLLLLLSLAAALALARLIVRPRLGWWLLFVAAMSAALYTHYAAVFLIPVQPALIGVLYRQERATRPGILAWLAAWPAVVLLYWPWLTAPGMSKFLELLRTSNLYPVALLASGLSISPALATTLLVLAALFALFVALILGLWLLRQERATWSRWAAAPLVRYGLLVLFLAATVIFVIPRVYTAKKLVVHLWPYALLVVAWIFPWRPSNRLPLALLLVASLVGTMINVTVVPKDQWREMAAYLMAQGEAGDAIWIAPRYQAAPLNYYLDARETDADEALQPVFDFQPVLPTMEDAELEALVGEKQRVWLVYHSVDVRSADPKRRLEQWLTNHMQPTGEIHLYKVEATLYTPQP